MDSILLTELDKRIRTSPDSVSWARDVLRAASHFARQGQVDVALKWMDSVKQHFGNRIDPEVACWLMLAEGMQYAHLHLQDAYIRFRGAYGAAVTFKASRVRPCCAAWMAHIEFNEGRFESMICFLEEALSLAPEDDHQARARASTVLADALHFAASFAKARPWYERARWHAAAEGDGATMSALMHNTAAFRTAAVCLADAFGEASPSEIRQAAMEASSASSYNTATGSASYQRATVPLLQAQLLGAQDKFEDALMILSTIDAGRLPPRQRFIFAIERARCLTKLGMLDLIDEFARDAADAVHANLEDDDTAYVLSRLSEIQGLTGRQYLEDCSTRAEQAFRRHRDLQATLSSKLVELESRLRVPPLPREEN